MGIKSKIFIILTLLSTTISYASIDKPETREGFEQKVKQQQAKIEELETLVSKQKKEILNLKWQIYYLQERPEPNEAKQNKKTETQKLQTIIEDQKAEIAQLKEQLQKTKIEHKSDTPNTKLSFFDIEYKMHKMNKTEWEIYQKNLVGCKVHWKGWILGTEPVFDIVNGVLKASDDVKRLYIEMEDRLVCFLPITEQGWDVLFWIPTDLAPKLNSGMEVEFKGTIESVTNMYGELDIHLKNVSVLRYEK